MVYHTGSVHYTVVINSPVLLYIVRRQILIEKNVFNNTFSFLPHVSICNVNGILPYEEQKICSMSFTDISSVTPVNAYTQKELVLLETSISEFHYK